jgi:hypothetical protein
MEPKPNPICKRGERNIFCPFYSDCLDKAINQFWQCWTCSTCAYRKTKSIDEAEYSADGEEIEYNFSPDIIRKIGKNGSG